jgi:hypothetical protein
MQNKTYSPLLSCRSQQRIMFKLGGVDAHEVMLNLFCSGDFKMMNRLCDSSMKQSEIQPSLSVITMGVLHNLAFIVTARLQG